MDPEFKESAENDRVLSFFEIFCLIGEIYGIIEKTAEVLLVWRNRRYVGIKKYQLPGT